MARPKAFDEQKAVDAAVGRFWSRGYEATSVRELAQVMGIGGASLYNTFGGKRALFARSLERYADRSTRARLARLEAGHRPKQAIRAFFAEIIRRSLGDRGRKGCLLVNSALDIAPHDAPLGRVVAGYLDEIRDFFRRNLRVARRAGQVPRDLDVEAVSGHLLGVVLGIRVMARTRADRTLLESMARPALALLDHRSRRRGRHRVH